MSKYIKIKMQYFTQARYLMRKVFIPIICLAMQLGSITFAVGAQQDVSSEQGATPIDKIELSNPLPEHALVSASPKEKKESPFFDDSKVSAQLRSFYLYRDKFDNSKSEAWSLGGSITYLSGYAGNLVRLGGTVYTSQKLYGPSDRDGTKLLAPGQESYTVLGQVYGEFKFTDQFFGAIGRKGYNTPYINMNDTRMTPNTFEGAAVYGSSGGENSTATWRYGGGYISKIKEQNSDEFIWMSVAAGANTSVQRGVYVAGTNYKEKDLTIGAFEYYSDDIIKIFYTEAIYSALLDANKLKLSAQYADQQSTGNNLLTGSKFSAHQWGVKADLNVGTALLTLAYTNTGDYSMTSPWGGYPGYTSVQVEDFDRANESAVLLRGAYDFSDLGYQGVSAYALWVHGSGVEAPLYNEDEYDFNLQWIASKASDLRGISIRVRYALIQQHGGGDPDINDFRFIVNYDFPRP